MNDSTENPLYETLLQDALHAHVRESGGDAADPHLVGLADGALRAARRRQRLVRVGIGITAAVVATAGVAVADGAPGRPDAVPTAAGGTGSTGKAAPVSVLPVTSVTEHACAPGDGGYTWRVPTTGPASCVHVDRAKGMSDVQVTSAKADDSGPADGWQVEVALGPADRARLASLTGSSAAATDPRDELVFLVDGQFRGVASVNAAITDGHLSARGDLTSATAHDPALRLAPHR